MGKETLQGLLRIGSPELANLFFGSNAPPTQVVTSWTVMPLARSQNCRGKALLVEWETTVILDTRDMAKMDKSHTQSGFWGCFSTLRE